MLPGFMLSEMPVVDWLLGFCGMPHSGASLRGMVMNSKIIGNSVSAKPIRLCFSAVLGSSSFKMASATAISVRQTSTHAPTSMLWLNSTAPVSRKICTRAETCQSRRVCPS